MKSPSRSTENWPAKFICALVAWSLAAFFSHFLSHAVVYGPASALELFHLLVAGFPGSFLRGAYALLLFWSPSALLLWLALNVFTTRSTWFRSFVLLVCLALPSVVAMLAFPNTYYLEAAGGLLVDEGRPTLRFAILAVSSIVSMWLALLLFSPTCERKE